MSDGRKNRIRHFVVPAVLLALALLAAHYLVKSRPAAPTRKPAELAVVVETIEAARPAAGVEVTVEAMGVVEPRLRVQLLPEVGGLVVWKSPELTRGGLMTAGAPLMRIDPRNYEAAAAQQRAAVEKARLELRMEEARKRVAEEEWTLGGEGGEGPDRELALREPQLRAVAEALAAAEAALKKAELDVERTELRAPFNGVALDETIDVGQVVSPQTRVAELAGTDEAWVLATLPAAEAGWLRTAEQDGEENAPSATVIWDNGAIAARREARLVRVLPDLDPQGRTARVLLSLSGPFAASGTNAIPFGAYVKVTMQGRSVAATPIPSAVLREGVRVWIKNAESRLDVRKVDVVRRESGVAMIAAGLDAGERLVVSAIPVPIPGMLLVERKARSDRQPEGKKTE